MKGLVENRVREIGAINPASTAVLAIHWQKDIVETGTFGRIFAPLVQKSGILARTANVLQAARNKGALVVYANVAFRPDYAGLPRNNALFNTAADSGQLIRGTPGLDVVEELAPNREDVVIEHGFISAFFACDLFNVLLGRGISTLAVTGVATNVAVDHTIRDAVQYGFRTILLEDCCCSLDKSHHDAALLTLQVLSTAIMPGDSFIRLLKQDR